MAQQPGIIQSVKLENFGPREVEITHNLATIWFVTNAAVNRAGKDTYPYVFLKPTDTLRERFSFSGNVLAIFHPFPVIDGRILNSIEKIIVANPNRLDRLCVLLISNANSVDREISNLNNTHEARVLIPFRYQELAGSPKGKEAIVKDRLARYLFTRDLFAISSALQTDRYFYGRKDDVQYLVGKYRTNENSSVFGLRRIGKTSVLWAVYRELRASEIPVVFIDCSDTKFHKVRWNRTLYRIREALFLSLGKTSGGSSENNYSQENASESFAKDLALIKSETGKAPLLVFDEIESLCFDLSSSEHWKTGPDYLSFWQTLRSIYQQNQGLFTFCLCGVNPRALETPATADGHDNPLYRYIEPKYLGFFNLDDVQSMIEHIGGYMGMKFEREIFTYLTDSFGGHPFLIRQAASFLYKKLSVSDLPRAIQITKHVYQKNQLEINKSLHDYVSGILSVLRERYIQEYVLLKYLAANQEATFSEFASEDQSWVSHLIGYGLIVEDSGRYHFRINVVRETLEAESKHLRVPSTMEERWALLSELRNPLEVSLRTLVKTVLRVSHGETVATEMLLKAMLKQQQIKSAKARAYSKIFDGELYFSDLRRVIEADWHTFHHVFDDDKDRFLRSMSDANRNRADAHAAQISEEDFKSAVAAIDWLSRCVSENA